MREVRRRDAHDATRLIIGCHEEGGAADELQVIALERDALSVHVMVEHRHAQVERLRGQPVDERHVEQPIHQDRPHRL